MNWAVFVAVILTGVLTPIVLGQSSAPSTYDQLNRAQTLNRDISFYETQTYRPAQTGTRVVLEVKQAVNTFNGVRLRHRSYNGGLVGPVIRVRRGSSLDVRLENHLPPEPTTDHDLSEPHGFNTTNLHVHGLHVSPKSPSDDVFLEISPGDHFYYHFDIANDHPSGTFWYHAHKHGSTALQLASGMAGALIIEGGLDDAPGVREAEEKILVLQQFVYRDIQGEEAFVDPDDVYEQLEPRVTAVNGQVTPTITMRPGEIQRWRIIHAGIGDPMTLKLADIPLHEIAVDGLALGAIVQRNEIELHPGYRSDVLIEAPRIEETYVLTSRVRSAKRSARKRVVEAADILKLVVTGPPKEMQLPTSEDLREYAPLTDADVPTDSQIVENRPIRMQGSGEFRINDEVFDPDVVTILPTVETAEQWEIIGAAGGHPFHIHVNPFAVRVPMDDPNPNQWVWRDTLFVEDGKSVAMRTWFRRHTGKTVIHCHMLDHEDFGMMQAIEIIPSAVTENLPASRRHATTVGGPTSRWNAVDPQSGREVGDDHWNRQPLLLILHRGIRCIHCAKQLAKVAKSQAAFDKLGVHVVAICQFLPESQELQRIRDSLGIEFTMLADPDLKVFKQFACLGTDGVPQHGVILFSPDRQLLWKSIDQLAETDVDRMVAQSRRALNDWRRASD